VIDDESAAYQGGSMIRWLWPVLVTLALLALAWHLPIVTPTP
jgi:hypothetical protein